MGLSGEQRGRIMQARQTLLTQMGDILQRRREIIQSLQVAWLLQHTPYHFCCAWETVSCHPGPAGD